MPVFKIAAIALAIAALAGCGTSRHADIDGTRQPEKAAAVDTGPVAPDKDTTPPPRTTRAMPEQDSTAPPPPVADSVPARIKRRFPEATAFAARAEPFTHGTVTGPDGIIGYEVDSDEAGTTQDGFGGPVPLLVWFDGRGRVTEVKVMGNDETPSYLDIIFKSGLLDSLKGYSAAEPKNVDAITLATRSSRSIIDGARLTAERVCRELLRR
ncbi:MAG: FMN-binding protein [bacterium]